MARDDLRPLLFLTQGKTRSWWLDIPRDQWQPTYAQEEPRLKRWGREQARRSRWQQDVEGTRDD